MIQGKILITGSSKGVGKEVARVFLRNNWNVCITSRNLDDLRISLDGKSIFAFDFAIDFYRIDI